MKIFKSAALLCAVSFTTSQASDCANPYGISQENTGNSRYIRVITEIPVGMLDSSHHGKCVHAGLPSASESCPSKKAGPQSLIESLLIELTKKLKVPLSTGDSENVFGARPTGGVETVNAARKAAAEAAKKANTANEALRVAELTALFEKDAKKRETMVREAAVAAERLMGEAKAAVANANRVAVDAVRTNEKSAFEYTEEQLMSRQTPLEQVIMRRHFLEADVNKRIIFLNDAVTKVMNTAEASDPLSTNVAKAYNVLKALRYTGAMPEDILQYWSKISIPPEIKELVYWALPGAI